MRSLEEQIMNIDGVVRQKSKYSDNTAFFVGKREIAHFHGENEIDIRLTEANILKYRSRLNKDPENEIRKNWVALKVGSDELDGFALEMIELAAVAAA